MATRTRFVQPGKIEIDANERAVIEKFKAAFSFAPSSILSLMICGSGMYASVLRKKKKDGSQYKDFFYYCCRYRRFIEGHIIKDNGRRKRSTQRLRKSSEKWFKIPSLKMQS